jgi:ribosomal protein L27
MSKLPVVSGAECVKALGKIGFVVYRQRGSHEHSSENTARPNDHSQPQRTGSGNVTRNHSTNRINRRPNLLHYCKA